MLVELRLVEQRHKAVLEVLDGASVTDVARRFGVARQTVHVWLGRYANHGLAGLADKSSKPLSCPHQMTPELEARIVAMRTERPGWGPRTILYWLEVEGFVALPGRTSIERCLIRHGLVQPKKRRRPRSDYKRWERFTCRRRGHPREWCVSPTRWNVPGRPGYGEPRRFDNDRPAVVPVGGRCMDGDAETLVALLRERGASDDEISELADPSSTLPIGEVLLRRARPTLTLDEVAHRVGLQPSDALRIWGALGFARPDPGDLLLAEPEAEASALVFSAWHLFGADDTVRLARVIGLAAAHVADAVVSTFHARLAGPALGTDPSRLALARSVLAAEGLLGPLAEAMEVLLRRHLIAAMRPILTSSTPADHDRATVAAGFVDLVGYTALVPQISDTELAVLLTRLEELSQQMVGSHGGRLVKMIGDAVMFVAPSALIGCRIARDILASLEPNGLPPGRGGVDFGEALTRGGDYFGSVVNLASRLATVAAPGELLCTSSVKDDAAGTTLTFEDRGAHKLKGIEDHQHLYAVTVDARADPSM